MDFWETIHRRHSVRDFDPRLAVPDEQVERLLAAATEAPSGGNRQPWAFVVVRDPALRRDLVEAALGQTFLAQAPVVIVVCTEAGRSEARYGQRGRDLYCLQDTAAAMEHILLAATAMGLGSCWVGAFDEAGVARVLELSPGLRAVAMAAVGHGTRATTRETQRRPLHEVVTWR